MSFGSWPPWSVCSRSTSRCMYSASASTFLNSNAQNSGPRQSLDRCVAKSWFWMRVSIRRSELPVEVDSQMVVRAGESSHGCSASTLGSTARRTRARIGHASPSWVQKADTLIEGVAIRVVHACRRHVHVHAHAHVELWTSRPAHTQHVCPRMLSCFHMTCDALRKTGHPSQ